MPHRIEAPRGKGKRSLDNALQKATLPFTCHSKVYVYKHRMIKKPFLAFAFATGLAVMVLPAAPGADARDRGDQQTAREQMKAGKVLKLRQIESRILPSMRDAQYLGPEYDSRALVYRLKFIRGDRVIFVDVDARSGRVLRRR